MPARNRKSRATPSTPRAASAHADQPSLISGRWLAVAVGATVAAAAICAWAALCLLFWQGSWQLLFHPSAAITRTPASIGLAFEPVSFSPDSAGQPQLQGWWIPHSPAARDTVLYLHGADGNLSNTVDALQPFAAAGLNIFVFDYRGYGQSARAHPSEARWRQDAEAALTYLTATRHIPASALILAGSGLGANLALQLAAAHPELAGVLLDQPLADPMRPVFGDPRAKLVPSHALVSDRFDLNAPAAALRVPLLWFHRIDLDHARHIDSPTAYQYVTARKSIVLLPTAPESAAEFKIALSRWLDDLEPRH
ncbi:MAG: alpha/beta fold hydrolase [Terracidiphilus sp.]